VVLQDFTVILQEADDVLFMQDRMYYSLIGQENALKYFYVDPNSGDISLKRSIAEDTADQYQVI
jgi:hypothetical protein